MAFCSNCGTQYSEGARFCPNCGAPVATQPMNPGYAPPPRPPSDAGYALPIQPANYPGYAPPPQPMPYYDNMQAQPRYGGKSKIGAVLLAIVFGYWTWIYTFQKDRVKFVIALILSLAVFAGYYVVSRLSYVSLALSLLLWLWPLADTVNKKAEWYTGYR